MDSIFNWSTLFTIGHSLVVAIIAVRLIMSKPATGVALAWLFLVAAFPVAGVLFYLFIGERRIGHQRESRIGRLLSDSKDVAYAAIQEGVLDIDWSQQVPAAKAMDELGRNLVGSPAVHGSRCELFSETDVIFQALIKDVDAAKSSVLMEFYLWNEGGTADEVLMAVIRAAERGVSCRILIDALGARPWWRGKQPKQLRDAGVQLRAALPVGFFRTFVGRTDLRLHRKIVVIDGDIGWCGSMNMVDPRFFKRDSGVGEWVDAMTRLEGSVVVPLAETILGDWVLETGESPQEVIQSASLEFTGPVGKTTIQVIPSGPGGIEDGILQMLLALINASRDELVLTTPYLVPDDSISRALRGAAGRGVKVSLILPERVDSILTRYASRSYYDELLELGVEICLYKEGLLHTKSITVDNSISMFGTVNMDLRSIWLNYEVALFFYDDAFTKELRALQQTYINNSDRLDPEAWKLRSFREQFLENALRIMSPLL